MATTRFIWSQRAWPTLRYDEALVAQEVSRARYAQGIVQGKLTALGFAESQQLTAEAWAQEAMATAAIEGEQLNLEAVRSSVACRLGVVEAKRRGGAASRQVDGLLDIMNDAVENASAQLTHERLCGWQAALFPTGFSSMRRVVVGAYRHHEEPMQIVSGRVGRETIRYQAPPSALVLREMNQFLKWFNGNAEPEGLVKAALAHLWFETVHPFEDGNGRVGRVIIDLVVARAVGVPSRLARISQQLLEQRDDYYSELEQAQRGGLDVTRWVVWFISQVLRACERASAVIDHSLVKPRFWAEHREKNVSTRQRKVVNVLLDSGPDGFEGGMSTKKYQHLTSASRATSSRELLELVEMGLLVSKGGGRSTRYQLNLV